MTSLHRCAARASGVGFALLALAVWLSAGCATRRDPARARGQLFQGQGDPVVVTRTDTELAITWTTRPGQTHTLVYKDRSGHQHPWRPVPDVGAVAGTGASHTVRLRTWAGDTRRFNVISVPVRPVTRAPSIRGARP